MFFNLKDFIAEQSEGETDWEIDLSPLLALMVTLIPVLLLQTSFATLKMIETTLPVLSDAEVKPDDKKKDQIDFNLSVFANKEHELVMELAVDNKTIKSVKIKPLEEKFDYKKLQDELFIVKKKYPKENRLKLMPGDGISYSKIVKLIDSSRVTPEKKPMRFTASTGENLETTFLFPDVVFGNITN